MRSPSVPTRSPGIANIMQNKTFDSHDRGRASINESDSSDSLGSLVDMPIELDDSDDELFMMLDLTIDDHPVVDNEVKHPDISSTSLTLDKVSTTTGLTVKPGMTVELLQPHRTGHKSLHFLRVESILRSIRTGKVTLRGTLFRRNKSSHKILLDQINEVYMIQKYNNEDPRSMFQQSLEEVSLDDVLRERELIQSNQIYPALSCTRWKRSKHGKRRMLHDTGHLVCRVKYIKSACRRPGAKSPSETFYQHSFQRISQQESDPEHAIPEQSLRTAFAFPLQDQATIDLTIEEAHIPHKPYTFAEGFCGAGGIGAGAKLAGLDMKWAFDYNPICCETYRVNFPGSEVLQQDAYNFIMSSKGTRVDILHLSPPCQSYSPANTVPGRDDDANSAALFSIPYIVRQVRPRIVTVEETSGLKTHWPDFLHVTIHFFTSMNYSTRWTILDLSQYGVPQARKRLIIIASCPGEPLPPFPTTTHGPDKLRWTTIADAISSIQPNMPNHDFNTVNWLNFPPYDPNRPLKGLITCTGGHSNVHPSGLRDFTNRELASLQTFPVTHYFVGLKSQVRKQVGNAVPPVFAQKLFETIIATLRATDAAEAGPEAEAEGEGEGEETEAAVPPGYSFEHAIIID